MHRLERRHLAGVRAGGRGVRCARGRRVRALPRDPRRGGLDARPGRAQRRPRPLPQRVGVPPGLQEGARRLPRLDRLPRVGARGAGARRADRSARPGLAAEIDALYDSLIALRPQLRNIGDAAASKALHQLLPGLVVMWDKAIRNDALAAGYETYGAFLVAMHDLVTRLLAEAGLTAAEAEAELGGATLAKHVH